MTMWVVKVLAEDMPILQELFLYQDKFYADRQQESILREDPSADVSVTEIKVEDATFCKPSTRESKLSLWGKEYEPYI